MMDPEFQAMMDNPSPTSVRWLRSYQEHARRVRDRIIIDKLIELQVGPHECRPEWEELMRGAILWRCLHCFKAMEPPHDA